MNWAEIDKWWSPSDECGGLTGEQLVWLHDEAQRLRAALMHIEYTGAATAADEVMLMKNVARSVLKE